MGNEVPKEGVHYICIACIRIDSVMKMETDLNKSKKLLIILLTLNKSKKIVVTLLTSNILKNIGHFANFERVKKKLGIHSFEVR